MPYIAESPRWPHSKHFSILKIDARLRMAACAAAAPAAGSEGRLALMSRSTWFQRLWLPGLAFKAAVIGGGYATGRELASFFLPSVRAIGIPPL